MEWEVVLIPGILFVLVMAYSLYVIKNPERYQRKGWSIRKYSGVLMALFAAAVVLLILLVMSMVA